ncbi:MAG: orotidine-5'-phosphate decarboxylase [Acidobacteriota bacterium]|nr:orotidine-5'-phosphate decarboxylase [Acidobacteriota bacterium]
MFDHDPLIVALDVESASDARDLVDTLSPDVRFFKVGMELYAAAGMDFVKELATAGHNVFLDMKFYDIGETVRRAVAQAAKSGARFLTVHGSREVMRAAVEGRSGSSLQLLGITVLTSFDERDLRDLGYECAVSDLVALRVKNARECGMDGVVASPMDARAIRELAGPEMLLVTPGVRSPGAATGDQKRVAAPAEAIRDGADYLVIGRQVTRASDPVAAVRRIRAELEAARA